MYTDKISICHRKGGLSLIMSVLVNVFCLPPVLEGQVPANIPSYLSEKLLKYCQTVPWEDLYIHTDRTEYIAGEDLWFNTYLIDRQIQNLSDRSKIACVEILNAVNMPVAQKSIGIKNGIGQGHFILPDSLSTGKYLLRAYTNRMKNFPPECYFLKEIYIYNTLKNKTLKTKRYADQGQVRREGNSVSADNSGQELKLIVNNNRQDSLEIFISINDSYRISNNNLCYLLIQTRGNIDRLSQIRFSTNKGRIALPKISLTPGINQITVFNSMARPVSERYIYTPEIVSTEISLIAPASSKRREKITLEINPGKNLSSGITPSCLSISVTPVTDKSYSQDLADYLVFGSEFGYLKEEIRNKRFSDMAPEVLDSCLLTLKSNWIDWDKILSENIPSMEYGFEDIYHFVQGRLEYNSGPAGSNKFVILSKPGKYAYFQYAITDNKGNFTFEIPVSHTREELIVQPVEIDGNPEIHINSSFSGEFIKTENTESLPDMSVPSYISDWSRNYQVNKIYGSVYYSNPPVVSDLVSDQKRFYGKPDIELVMDDYIKLPVMQEVFFELIPGVFLKSRRSKWEITMSDPVTNLINYELPFIMIDGVVIDDPALIANLDPELVEKIDVVKYRYMVGDFLFHGIVNVITRSGDLSNINLPRYAVRVSYKGTEIADTFRETEYSAPGTIQSRIPDFRNTLYWNPELKPDKEGRASVEFWSSDVAGDYVIDIQGITGNGTKVSIKKLIKIR